MRSFVCTLAAELVGLLDNLELPSSSEQRLDLAVKERCVCVCVCNRWAYVDHLLDAVNQLLIIDREAREIMHLVAFVHPSVCPSVRPSVRSLRSHG